MEIRELGLSQDTIGTTRRDGNLLRRWAPAAIALAGFVVYLNSFEGVALFDDPRFIDDPALHHLWPVWRLFSNRRMADRPLIRLSIAVNYAMSGSHPWSYHAVNLAVHLLAGVILYGIIRRTLLMPRLSGYARHSTALALVIALIWTVHPLGTQAVTYIIQRCESMMGLGYLGGLYFSIRAFSSDRPGRWYAAAVCSVLAAGLCKQVIVTAPLMVFLYDFVLIAPNAREALARRWPLYLGLALSWPEVGVGMLLEPASVTTGFAVKSAGPLLYLGSEFKVILYYIRLAIVPYPLCFDYGWPAAKALSGIIFYGLGVTILLLLTAWALARKMPVGLLGAWFFLILGITSSIVPITDLAADHRMYLPLASVVTLVVLAFYEAGSRLLSNIPMSERNRNEIPRRLALIGVTTVSLLLGFLTVRRNIDYTSEIVMWGDVVRKRPDNARGQANYALLLVQHGRLDEALAHYARAVSLDPAFEEAHLNYGVALVTADRLDQAESQFAEVIKLRPDDAKAHFDMGCVWAMEAKMNAAVKELSIACNLKPDFSPARGALAEAMRLRGQNITSLPKATAPFKLGASVE